MKKLLYFILIISIFSVLTIGFIAVSNKLPNTIKNRSFMMVDYKNKPFNLIIKTDKYIVTVNSDTPYKIYKTGTNSLVHGAKEIYIFLINHWISIKKHYIIKIMIINWNDKYVIINHVNF